jgi:hypothetical protein
MFSHLFRWFTLQRIEEQIGCGANRPAESSDQTPDPDCDDIDDDGNKFRKIDGAQIFDFTRRIVSAFEEDSEVVVVDCGINPTVPENNENVEVKILFFYLFTILQIFEF